MSHSQEWHWYTNYQTFAICLWNYILAFVIFLYADGLDVDIFDSVVVEIDEDAERLPKYQRGPHDHIPTAGPQTLRYHGRHVHQWDLHTDQSYGEKVRPDLDHFFIDTWHMHTD